ncbi:hypothetical protein B0A52_03351 [Exophiala mesophila]|uniref:histone acetyltransferase n=1 Tax=Exophiala mesophila TaxID=212818 RepID=A0A438NB45_EXOME|nr:hypothetical protein B0A52_03351 [Exophiala mesophila]
MVDRLDLASQLAAALPKDLGLTVYHISTLSNPSPALFAPLPHQQEEETTCQSHFLAVSTPPTDQAKEVLVFAVEVLIFASPSLTTLFVSKADSTGFLSRLAVAKGSPSPIATVISTFLHYLLEPRLNGTKVVLSLFARAQNQYLFPGSSENAGKHILNDRQLIKWWGRVLDKVLRRRDQIPSSGLKSTVHLIVPGCEKAETRSFFPPLTRLDPPTDPRWIDSYPVDLLVADTRKPIRSLIPRFPDDPKARFLEDLDGTVMDEQGNWRSVTTLHQFWEMMSYRQECSAGRLVGFFWMVFPPSQREDTSLVGIDARVPLPQPSILDRANVHGFSNAVIQIDPEPYIGVSNTSDLATSSIPTELSQNGPTEQHGLEHDAVGDRSRKYESTTKGELVLDGGQYQALMDYLLQTDFAGSELAEEHTSGWISKALEISGAARFGQTIRGEMALKASSHISAPNNHVTPAVNLLTGLRKKRKAEQASEISEVETEVPQPMAKTLATGLVRKKPKN